MNKPDGASRIPTVEQVSAGGAEFRTNDGRREVVIVKVVPEMRWQLPKGVIDEGETREQAALREVREEAGVDASLVELIETTEYWFTAEYSGQLRRYHKFVHFFLMEYVGGDVNDHDHEVDEARWVSIDDALEMLTFKSERDVVTKGAAMRGE
jgi:8-oxo-dGTP pyrophosphatase MutT (NUDIX family)